MCSLKSWLWFGQLPQIASVERRVTRPVVLSIGFADGGPEELRGSGSSVFHLGSSIVLVAIGSLPFIKAQWLFATEAFVQRETMLLCSNRKSVSSGRRAGVGLSLQSPLVDFFSMHSFCLMKEWLPPAREDPPGCTEDHLSWLSGPCRICWPS